MGNNMLREREGRKRDSQEIHRSGREIPGIS